MAQLTLQLAVELSFVANAQVSFKDENGYLRIKRFRSKHWVSDLIKAYHKTGTIELKVFIYTPNLSKDEEVKLSIKLNQQVVEEKSFPIPMDREYAGWFGLSYQLQN